MRAPPPHEPAVGGLETRTIARGIVALDAMVKEAPVVVLAAGPLSPGKYAIVLTGAVSALTSALRRGAEVAGDALLDRFLLADLHPEVVERAVRAEPLPAGAALGIVETAGLPALFEAADAARKAAGVRLLEVRVAGGLHGKGLVLLSGEEPADVEAAVSAAVARVGARDQVVDFAVIARTDLQLGTPLAGRAPLALDPPDAP